MTAAASGTPATGSRGVGRAPDPVRVTADRGVAGRVDRQSPPSPSPRRPLRPVSPSPTREPRAPTAVQAARLQRTLDANRAKLSIPGVSVAILWDDGRSWVGASGMRNIATADPMTTGTAFALASISKTFTAAVVLQLVEEGKLSLDQPVAPLLPAFRLDSRITVRMLLDHTSGLPDFFFGKGIDAALRSAPAATWTAAKSWSYVPKPHAVPGRAWIYSNTNYMLLGELVQSVTGDTARRTRSVHGCSTRWASTRRGTRPSRRRSRPGRRATR